MEREWYFIERCRVIVAKQLDIPPDDIDMTTLFECVKNAVMDKNELGANDYAVTISDDKEKEAFLNYGLDIMNSIFTCEYPFGDWIEEFEREYKEMIDKTQF